MKKVIKYHNIRSNHILATPEHTDTEIVEVESEEKLQEYIESQSDDWGHNFEKTEDKEESFGFDYTSNQGGVKVEDYNPEIKQI